VIIDFPGFLKNICVKGQRNGIRLVNFYGSSGSNVFEHKKKNISRPAYAGLETQSRAGEREGRGEEG